MLVVKLKKFILKKNLCNRLHFFRNLPILALPNGFCILAVNSKTIDPMQPEQLFFPHSPVARNWLKSITGKGSTQWLHFFLLLLAKACSKPGAGHCLFGYWLYSKPLGTV
jgi:hypothetical protein